MELRAKARRLHSRHDLGLIIVDYLQLMRPEDTSVGRVEQIGQMSRGLKILARELHVPVIAVSQLSRAVESRPDKRPLLSDLRESGSIEQDADVVMFIYRDEYYNDDTEARARPRSSSPSTATARSARSNLAFMARYPKFANLWRDHGGDVPARAGRDTEPERDSHARPRRRRRPVGRRGQGQGHRPPRRAGRRGHPLPGRQQRRPHDRPRRRGLQVPPDPVGDPLPRQAVGDRQRRGGRPARPARGARGPAAARHLLARAADLRERAPDHALPPAARPGRRGAARQAPDRHHAARHRPGLRRQGGAARHPRAGPARREDPAQEDRRRDGAEAPARCARGRRTRSSTCTR